jgi:hypothetical protein
MASESEVIMAKFFEMASMFLEEIRSGFLEGKSNTELVASAEALEGAAAGLVSTMREMN